MSEPKEKSKAQLEIERLKSKPLSDDIKAVIRKKEAQISKPINK